MREIKFRGLRKDGKGWVCGGYFSSPEEEGLKHYIFTFEDGAVEVLRVNVRQLLAVIGKDTELYEGDVLENPKGRKYRVVFWDNLPSLRYINNGKVYFHPMTQVFLNNKKLIGNIHENNN